tara:strand:- start:180 stop:455 length:276 start_codon:yes stop_codon:yes gene_type:complete
MNSISINTKLFILTVFSVLAFCLVLDFNSPVERPEPITITLTSKDTIYEEIDRLNAVSDTIKIYYETKVKNYTTLPTGERVRIFAERINRQ